MKFVLLILVAAHLVLVGLAVISLSTPDTVGTMKSFAVYYDNPKKNTEAAYQASVNRDRADANIFRGAVLLLLLVNSFGIYKVNRLRKLNA
ncbi:MAG: hypothetical protein ABIO65_06100 [Nitrospiria bacterium]